MKHSIFSIAICLALAVSCQTQTPKITAEQWHDDIRFFMEQAPKTHVSLYHTLSKTKFDSIGNDLLARVPQLSAAQIHAEFVAWVAAIGDGHSHLTPPDVHTFPVLPFWFRDGFWITDGQKSGKNWVGWRLQKINGIEVEVLAERLQKFQHRDGEQQIRAQAPTFLVCPEVLKAIGAAKNVAEKASFTFKNPTTGEVKTAELEPMPRADMMRLRHGGDGSADANAPLYRRHREKMYWFEWLSESKTLFFQYNQTQDDRHRPVADFIQDLKKAVDANDIERFVVDLRWNGGGNLFTSKPFTEFIAQHPKINQRGKLFVILGRHTFSAASFFASTMEFRTRAIFVGEATGASPNHFGDALPVRLPNSKLEPRLSSIFWQNSFSWDKRPATLPDLHVEPTAADWFANRDAALEAIFNFKPQTISRLEIPTTLKQAVVGRFLFEKEQVVDIREVAGKLHLSISDFVETDLQLASAGGELLISEIKNLSILPAGSSKIWLQFMDGSAVLERLPEGFLFPKEMLAAGKIAEGLTAFRKLRSENPQAKSIQENELNRIGYEWMTARKMEAARAVFELNTEFYPDGFNTWDSLGEWHMNSGNKAKAIEFYKKSIALNPGNANGKRMLEKLE